MASVTKDLTARYPHVADAEKAGYVRYTSPDDTGATSYADQQWNADPTHPSQLWYDKDGNLMGADFSVPRPNGETRPQLWGINPGRWYEFNGHVHYVIKDPTPLRWCTISGFGMKTSKRRRKPHEALSRHRCEARQSPQRQLRLNDLRVPDAVGPHRVGDAARRDPFHW